MYELDKARNKCENFCLKLVFQTKINIKFQIEEKSEPEPEQVAAPSLEFGGGVKSEVEVVETPNLSFGVKTEIEEEEVVKVEEEVKPVEEVKAVEPVVKEEKTEKPVDIVKKVKKVTPTPTVIRNAGI